MMRTRFTSARASQQPDAQQDEGINNEGMMDIEAAILALEAEVRL